MDTPRMSGFSGWTTSNWPRAVRTVVIAEAYIERGTKDKPQTFVCVIGEKGKVLLTLFSDK